MSIEKPSSNVDAFYRRQVSVWQRDQPMWITDYMARVPVFERVKTKAIGAKILDIGCGEGYACRVLSEVASSVTGIDCSTAMIESARAGSSQSCNITFQVADATRLDATFESSSFDACVSFFLVNNLPDDNALKGFFGSVSHVLKDGGMFWLAMPHPCFMLFHAKNPFIYYDADKFDYFEARHTQFQGGARLTDGRKVAFFNVHHTLSDVMNAICESDLYIRRIEEPSPKLTLPRDVFDISIIPNVPYYILIECARHKR